MEIGSGGEGDLKWKILEEPAQSIIIKASFGGKEATRSYKLAYEPRFGYDVSDTNEINRLLDEAIEEVKSD